MPIQPMAKKVPCECRRAIKGVPGKICDECQRRECFEWQWEKDGTGSTVVFNNDDRDVIFNPGFSVGTAAVRGTLPFKPGYHHYWEIEMSTEVYGTDMMIGVGTEKTDLRKYSHHFVSLLGIDEQSWGLSYSGEKKHGGQSNQYTKPFGQNSIIGVHLDLWAGTLEFYIDRKPLGLAFQGLRDKVLYPIITSTAARSGMNLIFCRSFPPSLQLQAMLSISKTLLYSGEEEEENASLFKVLNVPPGLKLWMKNNYWWIVSCRDRDRKREEELNNRVNCDNEGSKQQQQQFKDDLQDTEDSEDDGDVQELEAVIATRQRARRREGGQRSLQQCTQATEEDGNGGLGATSCMRLLAATSSRAHFLGRVSPIFVGMPEGGFSLLTAAAQNVPTAAAASTSSSNTTATATTSAAIGQPKPVVRSRSAPAQTVSASSTTVTTMPSSRIVRQPSTSEDEDDNSDSSATHSARKEPKRIRLRTSIDGNENADEDESKAASLTPQVNDDDEQN